MVIQKRATTMWWNWKIHGNLPAWRNEHILMPLNSHSYLVSQGWGGKGTGLRQGAISRPLAIPQKKTLAGLGKDRDEAFPFWDQWALTTKSFVELAEKYVSFFFFAQSSLFSAASKSIQIKCLTDDEEEENENSTVRFCMQYHAYSQLILDWCRTQPPR